MMEIGKILDKYQGTTRTERNGVHLKYYDAATNIIREMHSEYASGKHGDYVILLSEHWMILQQVFDNAPDGEKSMIFRVLISNFDKVLKTAVELMNRKYGVHKWPHQMIE